MIGVFFFFASLQTTATIQTGYCLILVNRTPRACNATCFLFSTHASLSNCMFKWKDTKSGLLRMLQNEDAQWAHLFWRNSLVFWFVKSDTLKETSFWISGLKLTTKWLLAVCSRPLKPLSAPCRLRGKQKSDSVLCYQKGARKPLSCSQRWSWYTNKRAKHRPAQPTAPHLGTGGWWTPSWWWGCRCAQSAGRQRAGRSVGSTGTGQAPTACRQQEQQASQHFICLPPTPVISYRIH